MSNRSNPLKPPKAKSLPPTATPTPDPFGIIMVPEFAMPEPTSGPLMSTGLSGSVRSTVENPPEVVPVAT